MDCCDHCVTDYFACIACYYENNDGARELFRAHGVLPTAVECPRCRTPCRLGAGQFWRCTNSYTIYRTKKRRHCGFSASDYKGTFLEGSHFPPWKIVLFLNHWLSKHWNHETVVKSLGIGLCSSVSWSSYCSTVTDLWFEEQDSIGGDGVIVEMDETVIVKMNYDNSLVLSQIWVFGGIERVSKKTFVVPLFGPVGEKRDVGTLLPLIKKYIRPGSVIISDQWSACHKLSEHGFTHYMTNNLGDFVDPEVCKVHTENIEKLWLKFKKWMKRACIKSRSLYQCLAKYLFIKVHKDERLHQFLIYAAGLYPPVGTNKGKNLQDQ